MGKFDYYMQILGEQERLYFRKPRATIISQNKIIFRKKEMKCA